MSMALLSQKGWRKEPHNEWEEKLWDHYRAQGEVAIREAIQELEMWSAQVMI